MLRIKRVEGEDTGIFFHLANGILKDRLSNVVADMRRGTLGPPSFDSTGADMLPDFFISTQLGWLIVF